MTTRGKGEREELTPLIERRTAAQLSQGALEKKLDDLSRGTVAQLENGTMLPPDEDLCSRIDDALGLDRGTLWREVAPYRLRRFDPKLAKWHVEERNRAANLPAEGLDLLDRLRRLAAKYADRPAWSFFRDQDDGGARPAQRLERFLEAVEDSGDEVVGQLGTVLHQCAALNAAGHSDWVAKIIQAAHLVALASMMPERDGGTGVSLDGYGRYLTDEEVAEYKRTGQMPPTRPGRS